MGGDLHSARGHSCRRASAAFMPRYLAGFPRLQGKAPFCSFAWQIFLGWCSEMIKKKCMEKSDVVPRVAPEVSQRPRGWAERVCRAGLGESWPEDLLSEGGATNPCPVGQQQAQQNKTARGEEAGGKWEPAHALLVGMDAGTAAMENSVPVQNKKGTALSGGGPTMLLLDPYPKE